MKTCRHRLIGPPARRHRAAAPSAAAPAVPHRADGVRKDPIPMAQRVLVTLADDLDGGEAAETIAFGVDGQWYEIDLSSKNADRLRKELAPYVEAGRRRTLSGRAYKRTPIAPTPATVRAWAQSNGFEVPARGRIPKKVYEAFNKAG